MRTYQTWLMTSAPELRCDSPHLHPAHLWTIEPGPGGSGSYVCPGTPAPHLDGPVT